jgi:hypothetical protein
MQSSAWKEMARLAQSPFNRKFLGFVYLFRKTQRTTLADEQLVVGLNTPSPDKYDTIDVGKYKQRSL